MAKIDDKQLLVSGEITDFTDLDQSDKGLQHSSNHLVFLWNNSTKKIERKYVLKGQIRGIYPLDNTYFITSCSIFSDQGQKIDTTLWRTDSSVPLQEFTTEDEYDCIQVIDKDHFMIGNKNGTIAIYHKNNPSPQIHPLVKSSLTAIEMINENHFITIDTTDAHIKLWQFDKIIRELEEKYHAFLKLLADAAAIKK